MLHQGIHWFRHLLSAGNQHSVHSPFIFTHYNTLIRSEQPPPLTARIEARRKQLRNDLRMLEVQDVGSAARGATYRRSVASIARVSAKSAVLAAILGRLAQRFSKTQVLDLGTSLGITTAYLAAANPAATVTTVEGCEQTLAIAKETFSELGLTNIQTVHGNLDTSLHSILENITTLDLVFFDANHTYEASMRYFNACLSKVHNDTVFILDDIYWSSGMTRAWKEICAHESVQVSVDLFYIGIVFFRKEQVKQHFRLRI
ncbi:MAG: class I SAM-dependent methyltransferase [Cytophagaceae bacterium]|jgi:predicted O-methyltransferase YrrM|nr:class I SAM-dependent methyltransferase [Cytophagaceae bacterium]